MPTVIGGPVLSGDKVLRLVVEDASYESWVETWDGVRWVKLAGGPGPVADFVAGRSLTAEELMQRGIMAPDPRKPPPLREVKTLRGIVPICSYCKKVRNDQGYWDHVDVHVRAHTEADFSHGICPTCLNEHFPALKETYGVAQ
jgi:hypothetical protein